jgi:hypothetical protein
VEGGESGIEDGGAGIVVVGGSPGDAEGVSAEDALGAVGVAAEDLGGADGGAVAGVTGEEGVEGGEEALGRRGHRGCSRV